MKGVYRVVGTPPVLMILVWIAYWLIYELSPIEYFRKPSWTTIGVICAGIVIYALAAIAVTFIPMRVRAVSSRRRTDQVIVWSGIIGLVGVFLLCFDKIFLSGLDYSQGLTAIRYLRDQHVAVGIEINRSPLLYIGYATFSAAYVSIVLFLLKAEEASRLSSIVAQSAVLSPLAYALLYGGRNPLLLLFTLVAGACLCRGMRGLSLLPRAGGVRVKVIALMCAFFVYTNLTWESRRAYSRTDSYVGFLLLAEQSWELQPSPWLDRAILRDEVDVDSAMNAVSILLYITHTIGSMDKIVEHRASFTPFVGAYQLGIISPVLRVFFPEDDLLRRMRDELVGAGLFGWFVPAWGAMFLDSGLLGAIVGTVLWGGLSGISYRNFAAAGDDSSALMLTFWLSAVFMSPLNSPIGMANSFQIFVSFVVAIPFLRRLQQTSAARGLAAVART